MHDVIVLIPAYRAELKPLERMSLASVQKYCHGYDIRFLAPDGLKIHDEMAQGIPYLYMSPELFDGFQGYNRLMMSEALYEAVSDYEFSLIVQLDALILRDGLEDFLTDSTDYIGALSWHASEIMVNGGLSLRRNKAFLNILHRHAEDVCQWKGNEDRFYSLMGKQYPQEFRVAPYRRCSLFSYEAFSRQQYQKHAVVPFGVHAFWFLNPCFIRELLRQTKSEWQDYPPFLECCEHQERFLRDFKTFLSGRESLFLYGAGGWGNIAQDFLRRHAVQVEGFLVSDAEREKNPESISDVPVLAISEVMDSCPNVRILFCINLRYRPQTVWDILPKAWKKGSVNVFCMDFMLYDFIGGTDLEAAFM